MSTESESRVIAAARALIYEMKSTCDCGHNINDCHCGNTPRSQNEVLADLCTMIGRLEDSLDALDREERSDVCEHGVKCGDWCELCNRAYKQAIVDNEQQEQKSVCEYRPYKAGCEHRRDKHRKDDR